MEERKNNLVFMIIGFIVAAIIAVAWFFCIKIVLKMVTVIFNTVINVFKKK